MALYRETTATLQTCRDAHPHVQITGGNVLSIIWLSSLSDAGYEFDICYTSVLKRAIRTLWLVLDGIDQMWLPVHRTWRLNERHYGGLTGLNKAETAAKHGEAQVKIWRRSFDIPPPTMDPDHDFYTSISKVCILRSSCT